MCRQVAIGRAHRAEPPVEQGEMHRFLPANPHPFVDECARKFSTETPDQIEGEIDRDIFDMGERMEHRYPVAV